MKETAAEEQPQYFEQLLDALLDGVVVFDAQGRPVRANQAAVTAFGLDPVSTPLSVDQEGLPLRHMDGQPATAEELPLRRALQGERVRGERYRFTHADGRELIVVASAMPLPHGQGAVTVWRDVTEREHLLAEAQRQRELLERIMQAAPTVIAVTRGPEHRFEYVNPAFYRLTKRTGMEVIGHPADEILPTTRGSGTLAIVNRVYQTGQPIRIAEHESAAVPGGLTYWNMDILPLRGSEGQVEGLVVLGQDITEQVLARRRVQELADEAGERAAELDAVFGAVPHSLIVFDPDGRFRRTNDAARALYRLTPEYMETPVEDRMAGRTYADAEGRPLTLCQTPFGRALRSETVRDEILSVRFAAGEPATWLTVSAAPLRGPGGGITGAVSATTDITALRAAQEQLERANAELERRGEELQRQAEELQCRNVQLAELSAELEGEQARLQAIVDQMPAALMIARAPSGSIEFRNRQADDILGGPYRPANSPGEYLQYEAFHADGRPFTAEELPLARTMLRGERVRDEEIHFVRADGSQRVLLASSSPIVDHQSRLTAGVLIFHDITERKELESQREALLEALRSSEERYRAFIEHSSEAIWRAELDRPLPIALPVEQQIDWLYERGKVTECNETFARLHEFKSPQQVAGVRAGQIFPRLSPGNEQHIRQFVQSGYRVVDAESIEARQDGGTRHFLNSLIGIVEDDHLVRLWGVQRDVTERKELEAQVPERRRLPWTCAGARVRAGRFQCKFLFRTMARALIRSLFLRSALACTSCTSGRTRSGLRWRSKASLAKAPV